MIPYIINAGLILAGCLIFYKILLQRETFYRVNRYILAICLLISFSLPLLPVPQQWSFRKTGEAAIKHSEPVLQSNQPVVNTIPSVQELQTTPAVKINSTGNSFSFQQVMRWLIYLYWFGVIAFAANFLLQIVLLLYRAYTRPVIKDGRFRIVEVSGDKAPCSFANNIFINPEKYEWNTFNQVILHEKVHIQQNHTLDILLAELVLIFQWFNPFAWSYRKEVEKNLEFLTDDHLVQHAAVEKTSYQLSLLQVSAPHFPLSVTTNYNQSLLKKRIAMMNSKKSNVHTVWKYFFLLPLLVVFACLLNEPVAYGQSNTATKEKKENKHGMDTEGSWFATIKGDKISFQFKNDEEEHGFNSSSFALSDFPNLPKDMAGIFKMTREAGTMEFTGKFEGNQGMGRYKFVPDNQYGKYMSGEINEELKDRDLMVFFFIDIKKSYVQMLKGEGYSKVDKDELIPLAALKVDKAFISALKDNGFKNVSLQDLIPLKSLEITGDYVKEIRNAGFPNVTAGQLITFKSQKIDGEYIAKVRKERAAAGKGKEFDADDIITLKALNIDDAYIKSFNEVGLSDISNNDIVSMKSLGITPEFVKSFQAIGYKNIEVSDLIPLKSQNISPEYIKSLEVLGGKNIPIHDVISLKSVGVTPEYAKSFEAVGISKIDIQDLVPLKAQNISPEYIKSFETVGVKNISVHDVIALKSVGVTPEYVKEIQSIGYKQIRARDLIPLKSQSITPEFIKGFEAVGYKDIPLEEIISLKAVGVTPDYIKSMKEKGFNYDRVSKYITLKSID